MDRIPVSTPSLRERGKAKRVAEIVSAASDLWRERGIDNVPVARIAAKAEVAPQTLYNLIGGVDAIAFEVIRTALERSDARLAATETTGVARVLACAQLFSETYVSDSRLFRQLLVRLPRVLFDGTYLGRDVAQVAVTAVRQAQAAGEVMPEIDAERLGRAIYSSYLGALFEWACGDTTDDMFKRSAEIAVLSPICACASLSARPGLYERLAERLAPDRSMLDRT